MAAPTLTPTRATFRQAVADVAAKARTKLPQCTGRIASAVKIVLAGDVELLPTGGARVASRSDATVQYHAVNGHCDCRDYARAPEGLCAHRLAYGLMRRASELVPQAHDIGCPDVPEQPAPAPTPAITLPALGEAPASVNCHIVLAGRQVQLTLRDTDETRLLQRLSVVLAQYPALPPQTSKKALTTVDATADTCPTHGPKKQSPKGKGYYCPHKLATGAWCPGT